ncbi:hypothetical protein BDR22DRAFT_860476 [Usnea florida]
MSSSPPIRLPRPTAPPPRSLHNIFSNLEHILYCRQNDKYHLPTLFATNTLPAWPLHLFLGHFSYLQHALEHTETGIPLTLRGEIYASLLVTEAEAEYLRREIECNFWRWHFRTGRQREEEDLGREREGCRRRWLGLLEGWEVVCRGNFDPVRDQEEVNALARLAALELE